MTHKPAADGQDLSGDFVGDKLFADLRVFIRKARPHTRLASARTLARKYGISPASVMLVMSRLVDTGLVYKIHGKGCFVTDSVVGEEASTDSQGAILFCYSQQAMQHLYYSNMREAVIETAADLDYRLQVLPLLKRDGQSYAREWMQVLHGIADTDVAGLIVPWVEPGLVKPIRTLRPDLPILVTQGLFPGQQYSTAMQDMYYHGYESGRYLLKERKVKSLAAVYHGESYLAGLKNAVRELRPTTPLDLFYFNRYEYPKSLSEALLRSDAEGIAFSEDMAACAFLRQLMELEPDFLRNRALISHSNLEYNILPPAVACLENDGCEFGHAVMSTMHSLLQARFPGHISVGVKPHLRLPFSQPEPDTRTAPPQVLPPPAWDNTELVCQIAGDTAMHLK